MGARGVLDTGVIIGWSILKVFFTETGLSMGKVLEMFTGRSIGNVF